MVFTLRLFPEARRARFGSRTQRWRRPSVVSAMGVACVGIAAGLAMSGAVGTMMAAAGGAGVLTGIYCYIR